MTIFRFLFIPLLTLLCIQLLPAQSVTELKAQLKAADTPKEKMLLQFKLGQELIRTDTDAALDYARGAYQLANEAENKGMAAQASYLLSRIYGRKRNSRAQESSLKNAQTFAMQAGDSDLILRAVNERGRLATKERNYRRATDIYQEAFEYFSQNGKSITNLENDYDLKKTQIDRSLRQLQREIDRLEQEKTGLAEENQSLTDRHDELVQEKETVKQDLEAEIVQREETLATVEEQRAKAEEMAKDNERKVKSLNRKALEKQAALDGARADLAEAELAKAAAEIDRQKIENQRNFTFLGAGAAVLLSLLMLGLYRSSRRAKKRVEEKNQEIEIERERSEELLLNILPKSIAEELKTSGRATARKFDQVTVLFSDFVNFTSIAEQLGPEELVEELDKCFKAFDFIISQYPSIEKIKTIGDAYMAASGLDNRKTIPYDIIRAALEMQEWLQEHKKERQRVGKPYFDARIGIHTGSAVAGVVGVNKFAYDIWGDTVNTAARLESKCEPGQVNISETTYNLVRYKFECTPRGKVEAKNKGLIDMYYARKELAGVG